MADVPGGEAGKVCRSDLLSDQGGHVLKIEIVYCAV